MNHHMLRINMRGLQDIVFLKDNCYNDQSAGSNSCSHKKRDTRLQPQYLPETSEGFDKPFTNV